ncbi:hypothetical protein P879_02036 [Paragonimus westermani]|uniref:Trematode PH-like domain-containing protein n=1 Tax=Paragonimus westermani TaxID=34504 RepID=A0A8T0DDC2_9TREM|nr:hypothetical protein P879_02036 [Paragonimus westermani]
MSRHHGPAKSSSSNRQTISQSRVHFTCYANHIHRTAEGRKHMFSAEEAEKLMQKHIKKKTNPVEIRCMDDGLHFVLTEHKSLKIRKRAYYRDIRHVFIYSLNPQLFMLCVEDSDAKGKKYYESFQCENANDVKKLCELTAEAKASPDSRLTFTPQNGEEYIGENQVVGSNASQMSNVYHQSYNSLTGPTHIYQYDQPVTAYEMKKNVSITTSPPHEMNSRQTVKEVHSINDRLGSGEYDRLTSAKTPNLGTSQTALTSGLPSAVSNKLVRSNNPDRITYVPTYSEECLNRNGNHFTNDISHANWNSSLSEYRSQHLSPTEEILGPLELNKIFGKDLSYVDSDRGPIYLYALRVVSRVETYEGEGIKSETNSPNASRYFNH